MEKMEYEVIEYLEAKIIDILNEIAYLSSRCDTLEKALNISRPN